MINFSSWKGGFLGQNLNTRFLAHFKAVGNFKNCQRPRMECVECWRANHVSHSYHEYVIGRLRGGSGALHETFDLMANSMSLHIWKTACPILWACYHRLVHFVSLAFQIWCLVNWMWTSCGCRCLKAVTRFKSYEFLVQVDSNSNDLYTLCPQLQNAIAQRGLILVGWYHSHPTYQPDPSIQDISNQLKYQSILQHEGAPYGPCLGIIVCK